MRDRPISLNEKAFALQALSDCSEGLEGATRIDGRQLYDYRRRKIRFGETWGHVEVHLGGTKVLAQTSCSVAAPYPDRPTEGHVRYNVELSPMASPAFETGRPSSLQTTLTRTLEQSLRESRALDTESLCIAAGEKVWSLRVDVTVLDHEGNLADAVVLAATASLVHFRRPYVSVAGEIATIHSAREHEPVPLAIHHRPFAVTLAYAKSGEVVFVDPSLLEESVAEGTVTVVMNPHHEICAMVDLGGIPRSREQMMSGVRIATAKVSEISEDFSAAIKADDEQRQKGVWSRDNVVALGSTRKITESSAPSTEVDADARALAGELSEDAGTGGTITHGNVVVEGAATASLFEGTGNAWGE